MSGEQLTLDIQAVKPADSGRRDYERTHPWLRFAVDLSRAPTQLWMQLGEARSMCENLGRIPLPPVLSHELHRVYLAKGVHGTTAIEGNTLSEEQVKQIIEKKLDLPPSMEYLQREVTNIINASEDITKRAISGDEARITLELICDFNRRVLEGLQLENDIQPGRIRERDVGVMRYIAPHWDECRQLLGRLVEWLNEWADLGQHDTDIVRAVIAHLYLAWIHPFDDGNGRTARLLEFHIMVNAGFPTVAAHLLSNHYNQTRSQYLLELDRASKSGGDVIPFLVYSVQGFADQLRQQVEYVQAEQIMLSWRDYVNWHFHRDDSAVGHRRRDLLLALSWRPEPVKRSNIRTLAPQLEAAYREKTQKTITRDLNYLLAAGLVVERDGGYMADTDIILGFLPEKRPLDLDLNLTTE